MAYALHLATLQTPVGMIVVEGHEHAISALRILATGEICPSPTAPADSPAARAVQQVKEYFLGLRHDFDVPLVPLTSVRGGVLRQAICAIPFGSTTTYGALAAAIESAPRAIGQACRRNPLPIIIPCHRVTSTNGPEFYSGGNGPVTKAWLIDFEHRTLPHAQRTRLL